MSSDDTNHMKRIMLAASDEGATLFRNNVAQGVVGAVTWASKPTTVTLRPGDALVRSARVLHAGLFKGSGDLIGHSPVTITSDMIGRTLPVFTSLEVKRGTGRAAQDQRDWRDAILEAGGIAGVAYTVEEAVALLRASVGGKA